MHRGIHHMSTGLHAMYIFTDIILALVFVIIVVCVISAIKGK